MAFYYEDQPSRLVGYDGPFAQIIVTMDPYTLDIMAVHRCFGRSRPILTLWCSQGLTAEVTARSIF